MGPPRDSELHMIERVLSAFSEKLTTYNDGENGKDLDIEILLHYYLGYHTRPLRDGVMAKIGLRVFFICNKKAEILARGVRDDLRDIHDAGKGTNVSGAEGSLVESSLSFYRVVQPKTLQQIMELIAEPGLIQAYKEQLIRFEEMDMATVKPGSYVHVKKTEWPMPEQQGSNQLG